MSVLTSEQRSVRAKIASLTALANSDPSVKPEVERARRDFRALKLEEHARAVVESWPPLTQEQVARVVTILGRKAPAAGD